MAEVCVVKWDDGRDRKLDVAVLYMPLPLGGVMGQHDTGLRNGHVNHPVRKSIRIRCHDEPARLDLVFTSDPSGILVQNGKY